MTTGPRKSYTTATVTATQCTHNTDVAHESHSVCTRTLHRYHQSCSSWHVTTKVLRRIALTQHAGDCMHTHVTVCVFISRSGMCRNGANIIMASDPRALPAMPLPDKPAQAQRGASGGSGSTGLRTRSAAAVVVAPRRRRCRRMPTSRRSCGERRSMGSAGHARRWSGIGREDGRQGGAGHACELWHAVVPTKVVHCFNYVAF